MSGALSSKWRTNKREKVVAHDLQLASEVWKLAAALSFLAAQEIHMTSITKGLALCSLTGLLLIPLACDNEINCVQICERYQECVTNIDVTECTDLCEDRTDDNDNVRASAERCEDCLDQGSCAETTGCFDAGRDCPVVVVRD